MYQLRTSLSVNVVFVARFVNCRSTSAGVQVWMQLQMHVSPHVFKGNPRQSWSLDSTYRIPGTGLFSFVNPFGMGPVRIPAKENESDLTIVSDSTYGPTFRDDDRKHTYSAYLHISDNANSSRSNRCCVHQRVYIKGKSIRELSFTGTNQFNVDDYEVFEFF